MLWPFCGSVLISIAPGTENPAAGFPALEDPPPAGRGPLSGILAAFEATTDADLLVLACDYPRVEPSLFRMMLALASPGDDLVMPVDPRGRDHPLVALWRRTTRPRLREAIDLEQHRVHSLLPDVSVRRVVPGQLPGLDLDRALLNLNWPADLERL